jgi:hypothetical protein
MKMVALNWTDRARAAATLIGKTCMESHRGASRYWGGVRKGVFGIVLYGNDGYAEREGGDPVINARTREYVHNLYAGLANLLPEGAVEFGTDEGGYSWVILAMFPRHDDHDDYQDEDAEDDALVDFWNDVVWEQWKSQLAFKEE